MPDNAIDEVIETAEGDQQPQAKPPKVVFDGPGQQEKVEQLIRQAKSTAAKDLRAERDALKVELAAARRAQTPQGEDNTLALAEARAELASLKAEREESKVTESLRRAVSGQNFFDAELATNLLRQSAKVVDGRVVFVDSEGNERLGRDFSPLTAAEAARELADQKAWMVRGSVRGGSGSTPRISDTNKAIKLSDYFGKNASRSGELHKLARFDKPKYLKLREAAHAEGLV